MSKVIVNGKASNKILLEENLDIDLIKDDLLTWLRSKKIPIASSCDGEGICKKCVINNHQLSCKTFFTDLQTNNDEIWIEISYL